MIVISDNSEKYYPHFIFLEFPPQNTAVADDLNGNPALPENYLMAYPNPVGRGEAVYLKSKKAGCEICIYNIVGQLVTMLETGSDNLALWEGHDMKGMRVSPGVYFAGIAGDNGQMVTKKMIVLQ